MKKISLVVMTMMYLVSCVSASTIDAKPSINPINDKTPFLTTPKVRKVWIPEKIEGDTYIEGHYIWVIEKITSWSK